MSGKTGKRRRVRVPTRLRRRLEALEMLAFILVALPLIIVAMPFVLTHHAWTERRRACPLCGERGSLEPVPTAQGTDPEDQEWSALRRRVNPENTVLKCRACGLHIRRAELEALTGAGRRELGR